MKEILLLLFLSLAVPSLSQNLLSGLQACYPLNGNANNYASSGSVLNGTLVGVTSAIGHTGLANTAYSLSGNGSSYIVLPDHSGLKNSNLFFTGWFKFSSLATNQYMVYTKNSCSFNFEAYALNAYSNSGYGNHKFVVTKSSNSCSYAPQMYSTTTISLGTWYHVCFFISNTSIKLYVNGVLEASTAHTTNFDYSSGKKVFIGVTNESYYNLASNVIVDNMRFYNRELSAAEVQLLYNQDPICNSNAQAAPTASFSVSAKQICKGQSVTFTNQTTNNPSSYLWSFPGGFPSTSTLTNPVVTYPISGTFTITLIASNSYGTSNTAVTTITMGGCNSISENQFENFNIYPNPSTGKISLTNLETNTFKIYDLTGKLIPYTGYKLSDNSIELDLSENAEGIYFISLISKEGRVLKSLKIILEK